MKKHQTSTIERRTPGAIHPVPSLSVGCWRLDVGGWIRVLVLLFVPATVVPALAQLTRAPSAPQPDPLSQLMVTQPSIEIASNVVAVSSFDPPVVRVGEKSIYRVTFNALDESIVWPEEVSAPPQLELRLSARGQVFQPMANQLKPQTTINHHVHASQMGSFIIPEFSVGVYGRQITVPAAKLEVVAASAAGPPPAQRLILELSDTNAYAGQPVAVRVRLSAAASNILQHLQLVKLNGDGFLVDQGVARQSFTSAAAGGRMPTAVYETVLTPLVAGKLEISAQGFTLGNRFGGPMVIQGQVTIPGEPPQNVLLDSDLVTISVRPLPRSGALPGFTGVIGDYASDPPQLSTNQVQLGNSVDLIVVFRGVGHLARFVPPTSPVVRNWQVSDAVPSAAIVNRPGAAPLSPGTFVAFAYKLAPLATGTQTTPAIPFSYFDPKRGAYVDLTIPAVPITVTPGVTATVESEPVLEISEPGISAKEEAKLTLSALATSPGRVAGSLSPLQQRGGFMFVQLLPIAGFVALWAWDRRRRYLEQHPDILLRRRARRALRRERRELERAVRAGDKIRYATTAVSAMRVACAPHYPAEPRALVCRDVLDSLEESERTGRTGEVVRRFFTVADASIFSAVGIEGDGLLSLRAELDRVLEKLEAKL